MRFSKYKEKKKKKKQKRNERRKLLNIKNILKENFIIISVEAEYAIHMRISSTLIEMNEWWLNWWWQIKNKVNRGEQIMEIQTGKQN